MRLDMLAKGLAGDVPEVEVSGFAIDNRKVAPGCVFGAFEGARVNGEDYIPQAVAAGAVAVVARPEAKVEGVFHVADANPRRLFAQMAARFYAPFPDTCVAVTGTNGKTSCVELTRQLWRALGHSSASIGTLGVTTSVDQVSTGLTTPDIVTFLSNMAGLKKEGITHAAFEASSHGLAQYRTEGLPVKAGAFTNLSRDHLDYHGTMDAYFAAKMRLFDEVIEDNGAAVIWTDDAYSDQVIARAKARGLRLVTVGEAGETLCLVSREPTALGQKLVIAAEGAEHRIELPLIGAYQAANVLIAAGLVLATGTPWAQIMPHLSRLMPVRGRLERAVLSKTGAPVYVDYAHTPDGLRAAIEALRPHTRGRLIVLFGAGGDRDAGKRPLMGKVASEMADHVIVTDDNPRSEDPTVIRAAIMAGAPNAEEIGGRRAAIAAAIAQAGPQDIVLLAGKGHEQGQIIGERVLPFDDVEVARECAR